MHDVLYWNWEPPFDREKIRRIVAGRRMAGGGRGRPHGPGGPHFGSGSWSAPFSGGMPGGPGFGRRRRANPCNVRTAALLLLAEEPRNGYQIMQELEERSGGMWRPSPGSVYPALQLLADEGLVRGESREGSTVYELTDAGRKHLEENREQFGTPWEAAGSGTPDDVRD